MWCVLILEWRWKRLDGVTRAFVANTTKLVSCASGYCRVLKSANPCVKLVGLMEDEGSELKDPKWTGDVVSKFLQSPVYSVPLLDFIDDNCSVFKDCNESNLECTIVRSNYMHYIMKPPQRTSIGPYRCHLLQWWNENVVDFVGRCILKSTSIISSIKKQIVYRTCLITMWMAMLAGAREFQAARGCSLIGFLVRFGNSYAQLCPDDSQVRTYALKDNLGSTSWNSKRFQCSESGTLTTEKAWHCDCYYFTSCPNRDCHNWFFLCWIENLWMLLEGHFALLLWGCYNTLFRIGKLMAISLDAVAWHVNLGMETFFAFLEMGAKNCLSVIYSTCSQVHSSLYSIVVTAILTVDNFCLFKVYLCRIVLKTLRENHWIMWVIFLHEDSKDSQHVFSLSPGNDVESQHWTQQSSNGTNDKPSPSAWRSW